MLGVHFLGFNAQNAHKLLMTGAFVSAVLLLRFVIAASVRAVVGHPNERTAFWTRQVAADAGNHPAQRSKSAVG